MSMVLVKFIYVVIVFPFYRQCNIRKFNSIGIQFIYVYFSLFFQSRILYLAKNYFRDQNWIWKIEICVGPITNITSNRQCSPNPSRLLIYFCYVWNSDQTWYRKSIVFIAWLACIYWIARDSWIYYKESLLYYSNNERWIFI